MSAPCRFRPTEGFDRNGELLYLSPDDTLMSTSLTTAGDGLEVGDVRPLFALDLQHHVLFEPGGYALTSDGERILVNRVLSRGTSSPITLLVGWPPQLEATEQ